MLKRANEYVKENIEAVLTFQIDFERKFGSIEDLEKAEEKLTSFLMKKEEEIIKIRKPLRKAKFQERSSNKKRRHEEFEEDERSHEPTLQKKLKSEKINIFSDRKLRSTIIIINYMLILGIPYM